MTSWLYQNLFYPLAYVLLRLLRPFLNAKTQEMVFDKSRGFFAVNRHSVMAIAAQRPFWIHAASGEIEYARPVIRELKRRYPETPVIVTFSSSSAKKILKNLPEIDAWGSLPWDFKSDCEEFLEKWQPRCCLIARTDVWPVMAETCREKQIPSLLFAATFAANSSRLRGLSAKITAWALSEISEIHCVSKEDVHELDRLKLQTPVHVCGDTRFDQVFHRLQHPKPLKDSLRPPPQEKLLIAGSTWPEDEKILLPAFKALKNRCRLILAPHEIHEEHLSSLIAELRALGLSFKVYSKATEWVHEDVLIVDEVGILAELYTWGHVAFVGGSFKKQVHSVMEPLAAGLPVLVGPFHHNNRESLVFQKIQLQQQNVVTCVPDIASFSEELAKILSLPQFDFSKLLREELSQHRHSSEKVAKWHEEMKKS